MDFGHHFHRNVQRPSVRRRSLQLCRPGVISGYGYPILEESIQFLHYLGTFQLALMMVSNFKSISNQFQININKSQNHNPIRSQLSNLTHPHLLLVNTCDAPQGFLHSKASFPRGRKVGTEATLTSSKRSPPRG